MLLFVTLLHIILCFILMLVILLQPGKGSDVGAAFGGGGGSSSIFGPRGAGSFLSQATTIVAILFMFSSIYLAWNSSASARSGSDVEDAMKRELRERIQGDVYEVPEGGFSGAGASAPIDPTPALEALIEEYEASVLDDEALPVEAPEQPAPEGATAPSEPPVEPTPE